MNNLAKNCLLALAVLVAGCVTSDEGAAVGRAVVDTTTYTAAMAAEGLAYKSCDDINAAMPRDACLAKNSKAKAIGKEANKSAPAEKFDDLETYKEKRDAELAVGGN